MTTLTSSSTTSTRSDLGESLEVLEVKPGLKFTIGGLRNILPDVETALFFGKVYELNASQLAKLLSKVFKTGLTNALFEGVHSTDLQDYMIDVADQYNLTIGTKTSFSTGVPKGEILPELWASLEIEIAQSIKDVAAKLGDVVGHMPGKQGNMVFTSMMTLNKKRPTIGDFRPQIKHARQKENLVILDVSGSMSAETIRTIVDDVVAMSYVANAHLAIVSNTCTYWTPGTYGSQDILDAAEFSGTHYEKLQPLFDRDWGVVVTIADYDSSPAAANVIARCTNKCTIDEVLDISLVNRPTYLAEVVGQLATRVRPILVACTQQVLGSRYGY